MFEAFELFCVLRYRVRLERTVGSDDVVCVREFYRSLSVRMVEVVHLRLDGSTHSRLLCLARVNSDAT